MSSETTSLIAFFRASGVPGRVTDIDTPGVHSKTSRHYLGLAVDLAGPVPSRNSDALLAVYRAFLPVAGSLHELIYGGPGGGRWFYGAQIGMGAQGPAHENHVHVSVDRGWRWTPPVKEIRPMFDPPLQIVAVLDCPTGGAWLLQANGGINAVGGAPFRGIENQPFEKPYWGSRTAARLESLGGLGYAVIAAKSGERYEYPA